MVRLTAGDTTLGHGSEMDKCTSEPSPEQRAEEKRLRREILYARLEGNAEDLKINAAHEIAIEYGDKRVIPLLLKQLENKASVSDADVYSFSYVLNSLCSVDEDLAVEQAKKYFETSSNRGVRIYSAELLDKHQDPRARDYFIQVLSEENSSDKGSSAHIILLRLLNQADNAWLKPHKEIFVRILNNRDYEEHLRAASVHMLGCIASREDESVIQALERASRGYIPFRREYEPSKYVRYAASTCLDRLLS